MTYEQKRELERTRQAELRKKGMDIGPIPKVKRPARRKKCERDLLRFLSTYFPQAFAIRWSDDHKKVIHKIQTAVFDGGLFALAMPRGTGKTTICERSALWALVYAHRRFVALVGATEGGAKGMLARLKVELELNDLLLEDFPHTCFPIRKLENEPRRCRGQTSGGEHTRIGWSDRKLVLPTIAGHPASGGVVSVCGLTGAIRGQLHALADGIQLRPGLVLLDDPQTRESARSTSQCASREAIVSGDVLGMAGPGQAIAAVMPCTVIEQGDLADAMLDRQKHPEWQGERTQLVYQWPGEAGQKLWDEYAKLRAQSLAGGGDGKEATKFYREHRAAMDEGSRVAWPERKLPTELSALQHAVNLRLRDPAAFDAEYQNQPRSREPAGLVKRLTAGEIAGKVSSWPRGHAPVAVHLVTAFIDVQQEALFWVVCGWEEWFTGHCLDYGTHPDQGLSHFALADLRHTLSAAHPGKGLEGTLYAGITHLVDHLFARAWLREDGVALIIKRLLIDAGWGASTDSVYLAAQNSPHAANVTPSHGQYVGASSKPWHEYKKKKGERAGLGWRQPSPERKRRIRHVTFDTNFYKSFVHSRLATSIGDPGCLTLFAPAEGPATHRLFSEHLTAEYPVTTSGRGRVVEELKLRVERPDNHWLDGMVGCAVGAAMEGCFLKEGSAAAPPPAKPKILLSQLQAEKRAQRRRAA